MYKAVIDNGNTRCKIGIFNAAGALKIFEYFEDCETAIQYLNSQNIAIAISNILDLTEIKSNFKILYLDNTFTLPFLNLYQTPQTLGLDRIAAMAAVSITYKNQNTLVFDAGTCLTIDFLDENNQYKGGNISPGLNMRWQAMHTFTEKLPLSNLENLHSIMGNSTLSAIANGAYYGIINEMIGYINYYKSQCNQLNIVLCGGDTFHFDKQLKTEIFAQPNLVLEGLYQILLLNENK